MGLTSRAQFVAAAAAAASAGAAGAMRPAGAATALRVGYFPGISALPLAIGTRRGIFAHEGLDVTMTPVAGSVELFAGLDDGSIAIGHTAIDNPIAYDTGRGDPRVRARDFVAILGVDDGLLRIVARPGIARILDLIGTTVAVDALGTGFTYALRAVLDGIGVTAGGGVTFVESGGTQQRAQGLLAGRFDATLLYPPFDIAAQAAGFSMLPRVTDVLGAYQGIAVVARRTWIAGNRNAAVAYARAYRAALADALRDRRGAIALITSTLNVSPAIASASYDAAFATGGGLERDATISMDGLRAVLRLRALYAPPGGGDDPMRYIDPSIYAALG